MDATPVTLGQEFGGYAAAVRYGVERLRASLPRIGELPLGGTAVGTGINTPPGFAAAIIERLAGRAGPAAHRGPRPLRGAELPRRAGRGLRASCKTIAVGLVKIANDLRWMGSGPRTGLGEIFLPDLQPGSSIMPGKVNPVIPEATIQVAAQVIGNDAAVTFAGTTGNFELNVTLPLMARNVLESIRLLANVSRLLADRMRRRHHRQRRALPRAGRVLAVDRHAAEQVHRLRGGGDRRQAVAEGEEDDPPGRAWSAGTSSRASSPSSSSTRPSTSSR